MKATFVLVSVFFFTGLTTIPADGTNDTHVFRPFDRQIKTTIVERIEKTVRKIFDQKNFPTTLSDDVVDDEERLFNVSATDSTTTTAGKEKKCLTTKIPNVKPPLFILTLNPSVTIAPTSIDMLIELGCLSREQMNDLMDEDASFFLKLFLVDTAELYKNIADKIKKIVTSLSVGDDTVPTKVENLKKLHFILFCDFSTLPEDTAKKLRQIQL